MTWWIALVAGAAGVLEHYRLVHLPFVGPYNVNSIMNPLLVAFRLDVFRLDAFRFDVF